MRRGINTLVLALNVATIVCGYGAEVDSTRIVYFGLEKPVARAKRSTAICAKLESATGCPGRC